MTLAKGLFSWMLCSLGIIAYALWVMDASQWWEYVLAALIIPVSYFVTTGLFKWALN